MIPIILKKLVQILIEKASDDKSKKTLKAEEKKELSIYHNVNSVGSDEVGTGDYFGPIVVTATYVTKDDVEFLDNLGVMDSKKISDEKE